MIILKVILFTVLINWSVSMQILNQTLQKGRQRFFAVVLALTTAAAAAATILI